MFNVVLIEPEIPQNTGNIGRLCVGTSCSLHLVRPLGFSLSDRYMKRAGLDYWQHLDWHVHDNLDAFLKSEKPERLSFFTKKAERVLWEMSYKPGDYLVFGRETVGLSDLILERFQDCLVRIPMTGPTRSINLSNSVSIAVYEGLRQQYVQTGSR